MPQGARPVAPSRGRTQEVERLYRLLDDDPTVFTVEDWRARNLALFDALRTRGVVSSSVVPHAAQVFLAESLITADNPAATDPLNAGHVRSQNEAVIHFGLSCGTPAKSLTLSLVAGFIHDLNKAVGEPLRQDGFAVRDDQGRLVPTQRTLAQSVGLNHLGERTRRCLVDATKLVEGALAPATARALDLVIVHHGLGSSRFIQRLVDGDNEWWGDEFVDRWTGEKKLVHPRQPPLTVESVLHDLADSTQQMEGGAAWLLKYPLGFWADSAQSWWDMLSARYESRLRGIPLSLRQQIDVETDTCRSIVLEAHQSELIDDETALRLERAVLEAARPSVHWVDDRTDTLLEETGDSVYHDVGVALGLPAIEALDLLQITRGDTPLADDIERAVRASARALDDRRTRALAELIAGRP